MKVLNSAKAFREHYATRAPSVFCGAKALAAGGALATSVTGASAIAAGTAAAQASAWSSFVGWPLIGTIAAEKATAAGVAAGLAAAGSAAVLVPAVLLGGGVAYVVYRNRKKKSLQKTSGMERLADAFARVACLPMMACAVSVCAANPANVDAVRNYVQKEMGAWGYAESYVRAGFDEALRHSPDEINGQYDWTMRQLASGSMEGIGATPQELPHDAVKDFAEGFRKKFASCIG